MTEQVHRFDCPAARRNNTDVACNCGYGALSNHRSAVGTVPPSAADKLKRIAEIDAMFEAAEHWGSWMWDASGERHSLVERLKKYDGVVVPHKYERSPG